MSGPSPIDYLGRLAPVADTEAGAVFGAAGRDGLLAELVTLPVGRRRGVARAPRRPLALAVAIVIAVATAAAAWAILGSSARETTSVDCVIAGTDSIIPSTSGDPAADCALQWQRDLGTIPPPLVAYDNGSGGVSVLPRRQTPPDGWKRLPGGSQDVALIQLQESLDDYVNGLNSGCLSADAATRLAQTRLVRFGFTGWTVTVRNEGACTNTDVVDPGSKTVTLIAGSAASGPETSFQKLADRLRPLTRACRSLPAAVAAVRSAAGGITYNLNQVEDNSLRCAAIHETVGGAIVLTVRGPRG